MKDIYTILKTLNELLENKEKHSPEDYRKKLLEIKDKIDQRLFMAEYKKVNREEQELLLQQYKTLIKMI